MATLKSRNHIRLHLALISFTLLAIYPVLWVIAVLSSITVIHRIYFTYRQTKLLEQVKSGAEQPEAVSSR